jgi:hypothetical protein
MGSNWAEEFRRRIEESEGKHRPAENLDAVDEEEWEEKEKEEDAELEESEDEAEEVEEEDESEEEVEEEVEPDDDDKEETREVEPEPKKPAIEKSLPTPVETAKVSLERQRFKQELNRILGSTTIQPAKIEVTKAEPVRPIKRETNDLAVAGAAMIGLIAVSLMPTLYQAMMQAFQPLIQGFQSLSGRSQGTLATGQEWVACPYCGYQCLGYNRMPCPRCGRS